MVFVGSKILNMFNIFLKVLVGNICNISDLYWFYGVEVVEFVILKFIVVFKMDKVIVIFLFL